MQHKSGKAFENPRVRAFKLNDAEYAGIRAYNGGWGSPGRQWAHRDTPCGSFSRAGFTEGESGSLTPCPGESWKTVVLSLLFGSLRTNDLEQFVFLFKLE